jgi:3-dehydro-L-gulonate 2-dehydrogenase
MANNPPDTSLFLRVSASEMELVFCRVLQRLGFGEQPAKTCALIFTQNSLDGVYTHGVNRFPRFVSYVKEGHINIHAVPEMKSRSGCLEQWNGNLGPGITNALTCTERAMEISRINGLGCVALSHTNHWMRGGTYGWHAAKAGFVFIGWTNTMGNMPAWGSTESRLGNNPLILAVPYKSEAIVLDAAMSQYSYGALELHQLKGEHLPIPGGYNRRGELSTDPSEILASKRTLPIGYWKGSGLALLLDVLATILSDGLSTYEISKNKDEHGLSQVFLAIDLSRLTNRQSISTAIDQIISDLHQSVRENQSQQILYPGERVLQVRAKNKEEGIPVARSVWNAILSL